MFVQLSYTPEVVDKLISVHMPLAKNQAIFLVLFQMELIVIGITSLKEKNTKFFLLQPIQKERSIHFLRFSHIIKLILDK